MKDCISGYEGDTVIVDRVTVTKRQRFGNVISRFVATVTL